MRYCKHIIGLGVVALALLFVSPAHAQTTSYDVHNDEAMSLNAGINATQTTDIQLSSPRRNGVKVDYATLSGGQLEFRSSSKTETIHYTKATVDATTGVVTLTGTVVRNVCFNVARSVTSCGDGQKWPKGTKVELVTTAFLLNMKANIDRANAFSASGAISFTGSGTFRLPLAATDAIRDAQFPNPVNGQKFYHTGEDVEYMYSGGSWTKTASGSVANAGFASSGKVELGTLAEQFTATASGSTNAGLVPAVKNLISSSTGVKGTNTGAIATLSGTGLFDSSLLGANTTSGNILQMRADNSSHWVTPSSTVDVRFEKLWGDGSDTTQAFTGSTTLDPTVEYNFTGSIIPASNTLSVSTVNDPLLMRFNGDVTINGSINLEGKGGVGGDGGVTTGNGQVGTDGKSFVSFYVSDAGNGGTAGNTSANGGGGGSSIRATGSSPEVGDTLEPEFGIGGFLANQFRNILCGAGGGGGASQDTFDGGGDGGDGGGCMIGYIKGNLTLGASSAIDCDGTGGAGGPTTNDGGGGGGGGGACFLFVGGTITDNGVTITANRGSGGGNGAGNGAEGIACIVGLQDYSLICGE